MTPKRGLGKGLSSLLGEDANFESHRGRRSVVKIANLKKSSYQPRTYFNEDELESLSASIQSHGILQPILVRELGDQRYEIVAGERRWRAAQMAGLEEAPVVIMDLTELQALEIALLENIQRQDLSPIEEAEGYKNLLENFNHTQESLSKALGKSRSHIANLLRILALPEDIKAAIQDGDLTIGHAKLLIGSEDPSSLAKHIITNRMSVQETNSFVKEVSPTKRQRSRTSYIDPEFATIVSQLEELTGMKTEIRPYGDRKGKVVFDYRDLEQLDLFLKRLSAGSNLDEKQIPTVYSI
jgi:ParB family chromosome partitioning protein